MERLKELLGLAADASDEDVVAAVTALQEQVAQANKDKEEAEAESFAEEHKAVCNKDALKKAYLLNKEAARGIEQAVDGLYSEYGVTTDEGSGLPVTSFVHGTPSRNKRFMNVACMMGAKLTRETSPANNKAPGYIQLVTA